MIATKAIIEWGGVLGMRKRDLNMMLRNSWDIRGLHWHREFRQRHFTLDAMRRYSYQPRTKSYNRRKMKKFGIALPLVFTGVSRALSGMGSISSTRNQVTVRMPVNAFNFKPKVRSGRTPIDMQDEFRRMSDDEVQAMDQRQSRFLERQMNGFQKRSESIGD